MLDYDSIVVCVALDLMHDYSYLTIWVCDGYSYDLIVVYSIT